MVGWGGVWCMKGPSCHRVMCCLKHSAWVRLTSWTSWLEALLQHNRKNWQFGPYTSNSPTKPFLNLHNVCILELLQPQEQNIDREHRIQVRMPEGQVGAFSRTHRGLLSIEKDQKFRKGVGGQRGLARRKPSNPRDLGLFSVPFFLCPLRRMGTHFWRTFGLFFGVFCLSPTPSRNLWKESGS